MVSVKNTIRKYNLIKKGDVIACAVSGGSDSMALLYCLNTLKDIYGFTLLCANVEHGIRGKESVSDTEFVKNFCEAKGIPFITESVDAAGFAKQSRCNLEQAARELRYGFFYRLIEEKICRKVFTAHNKKDNIETIMLNMLRGSGSKGVYGMDLDNGKGIIRPMLYTGKEEILNYIQKNDIRYVNDSTNFDSSYSRNYLRNVILPLLEDKFSGFYDNILRFSQIIKEEGAYIDGLSKEFINVSEKGVYINLPCDTVPLKHAVMISCRILGAEKDIESAHIEACARLTAGKSGSMLNLSNGINVYKDYGRLYLERAQGAERETEEIPFSEGAFEMGGYKIEAVKTDCGGIKDFCGKKGEFYISADGVDSSCTLRTRRQGDSFKRFKGGRKSLSDYFTDIKAPKRLRDSLPLLCKGNNVLVAFPYDISDDVKINENTKKIFYIKYRRIN